MAYIDRKGNLQKDALILGAIMSLDLLLLYDVIFIDI